MNNRRAKALIFLFLALNNGPSLVVAFSSLTSFLLSRGANVNALVEVVPAVLPRDVPAIQDCRQEAFAGKKTLLQSERSFIEASAVLRNPEQTRCLVARERLFPFRILGTLDIRQRSSDAYINNVFVRSECRGLGLAGRLMEFAESNSNRNEVSLVVSTTNVPAITVYRRCGYGIPGIHSLVYALSQSTGADLQIKMNKKML